jgi:hypothetical protein
MQSCDVLSDIREVDGSTESAKVLDNQPRRNCDAFEGIFGSLNKKCDST